MVAKTRLPILRWEALVAGLVKVTTAAAVIAQPVTSNQFINILTSGIGSVFYPLGGALSDIFAAKIPGTRPSVQATKGSVENLNLLQQGRRSEIAFAQGNSLVFAWAGDMEAGFKTKLDKLRGIAALYPSYIQIVATKESGIKTLADLKGKRLSLNAQGSGTELNTRQIFRAAGITFNEFAKVVYLPYEVSVDLMRNGELDATFVLSGLGTPAVRGLASSFLIYVVEIPAWVVDKAGAPFVKGIIPKDTYKGQGADVQTATILNYLVTRADLSAEIVYNMTKAVFDSTAELTAAHSAAADIKLERALDGMPIPLQPGAEKLFKEKGLVL
jgi:TRAP transporter TAXI family solute receptor